MSKAAIYKAIQTIANELLVLAHTTLETDNVGVNPKSGRNTLSESRLNKDLVTVWQAALSGNNDVVVTALFNNYVQYLDWQRPKKHGKKPPIDVLKEWASQNGISNDADTLWAISTAIWRDGHARRPIFGTLDEYCNRTFESDWADKLFQAVTDELDEFFNS